MRFSPEGFKSFLESLEISVIEGKKIDYVNIPISFDIECTNYEVVNKRGRKIEIDHYGFMYLWGIMIETAWFYGRTWDEFESLLGELTEYWGLSSSRRCVIYVHNLSYEFAFLMKRFEWCDLFARYERKPLKAVTDFGVEFRCSYFLSGYSLKSLGEIIGLEKLDENYDYSIVRTPVTRLSDEELLYNKRDCEIVKKFIEKEIIRNKDVTQIPMTRTGYVRRLFRDNCFKYYNYRTIIRDLTIEDDEYIVLKSAFQGGFTHASFMHIDEVIKEVAHKDITSSYPTVAVSELFPMSKGERVIIYNEEQYKMLSKQYCLIGVIEFEDIECHNAADCIISESRMLPVTDCGSNEKFVYNGRVYAAEHCRLCITEIDYEMISRFYTWNRVYFGRIYKYKKSYLPKPMIETFLELYRLKTLYKGDPEHEDEYEASKRDLNGGYGMIVTNIVMDAVSLKEHVWHTEKVDKKKSLQKYNKNWNRFLFYPWGVYITAYARRNLFLCMKELGDDYIYSDTDALFYRNGRQHEVVFEQYNQWIQNRIRKVLEWWGIETCQASPPDKRETPRPLGIWSDEPTFKRFKTIGAKRYMGETVKGEEIFTVSGVDKKKGAEYIFSQEEPYDSFNWELSVPEKYSGRLISEYRDEKFRLTVTDYQGNVCEVEEESSVALYPAEYNIKIISEMKDFLDFSQSVW